MMWDERYDVPEFIFGTEPNVFLTQQAYRLTPGQRVLAVADGEGRNGVWLAQQGLSVLSVEGSGVAQAKAKKLAQERGVSLDFECADLLQWQWDEARFDAVVAIFIQFAAPAGRKILFDGMKAALKPGGLLLLQGYTPRQLEFKTGGPSSAENMYTEAMLRELLAGWEIVQLHEHDEHISEGAHHHGMSALIDVVARKPG
ncbi:SAM-dependent methyltransferase [Sulfuriferula sp. AH1]|uniref:SAM-dependent methyltransferase n=1 Tax=Sulfuriferula sp. AH1 TaxID=1985873 RepID=UPI000B573D2E|nr:class I SAM-dependent methyltransferase [Sulfuriferula sp. AH1]ARU30571.1 SAM-dependent methyltransferase [Sulfuriferula sp. AH1]